MASTWSYLLFCVILIESIKTIESCYCKMEHPQQLHCSAHYVIVARIRGVRTDEFNTHYRIKVSKVFKATEKASVALQQKEIYSPVHEHVCGVKLEKGKTYLLTGRLVEDKLRLVICDFYKEWNSLSLKQKKGFKLLYNRGCNCKILPCPWWNRNNCQNTTESQCSWDTINEQNFDCQGLESVCMKQANNRCGWNRSMKFRGCLKERKEHKEWQRKHEP